MQRQVPMTYVAVWAGLSKVIYNAAGRLVTVCLAKDIRNVENLLRADAKPFIAAHLKDSVRRAPRALSRHRAPAGASLQPQALLWPPLRCPSHAPA